MKSLILPSAVFFTCMISTTMAQGPRPRPGQEETTVTIPNPAVSLTEAQVTTVLTQLKELEGQILEMRGSTLSTVMARLRQGMASDQAAMNLYLECDKIVNSERKEADKSEARKRQEDIEKKMDRRPKGGGGAPEETGDFGFAVKLGLQYLILTLEAHEAKDEDFNKMIPKLQEYIQTVVAAAPKLKGRASGYLNNALSPSNPIVDAFSLSRYLNRKEWSTRPMDIGSMYTQTLLPLAEQENKELLPGLWDARITAEGVFRKENMFAPEFELWTRNELPTMRWQRAMYLYQKGPSPINALADMLKVIKENQSHADAPKWVTELRQLVNHSAPTQKSENLDSASSSEQ